MKHRTLCVAIGIGVVTVFQACASSELVGARVPVVPRQIIDLSPMITEDLPVRVWGQKALKDFGFSETTQFRLIQATDPLYVSNAYWTLMNHAGPHVDAPNHLERNAKGVDAYELTSLVGPIKLIDVRGTPTDQPIAITELDGRDIRLGDVVIMLTGYAAPGKSDEIPAYRALSKEAADYLAGIPVKAFGTDGLSVDSFQALYAAIGAGKKGYEALAPVHHALLTQGIATIEQLTNLEALVGVERAVFVGLPLKVRDGDASPIRAAAFVY
jgi:arylformamidase